MALVFRGPRLGGGQGLVFGRGGSPKGGCLTGHCIAEAPLQAFRLAQLDIYLDLDLLVVSH